MPRPPAIPLLGKFYSAEGIYLFNGRHYKPRWYANALKAAEFPIEVCKLILEEGYREDQNKLPQAILVVSKSKWEEIANSYATWVGLTMFHYFDNEIAIGLVPQWLDIGAHNTKLIHEFAPGEVAFLSYWEDDVIYKYFVDSPPPQPVLPQPGTPQPGTPQPGTPQVPTIPGEIKVRIDVYHHPAEG